MNSLFLRAIFLAILGLGLGLLSPQSSEAHGKPVHLMYAGSGINTAFNTGSDDFPVSVSQANGKGTFGKFAIAITAEFGPDSSGDCAAGELDLSLVSSEDVLTFSDQSQLLGVSGLGDGFVCVTSTGWYHGQVEGAYVGGTGRFEGATGTFTSEFDGQYLGSQDVGFRSIAGTAEATLYWPK